MPEGNDPMTEVIVGKWGSSLAVRVPLDVARAAGLKDGEHVEVATEGGDIIIRRHQARSEAKAEARRAAAAIVANSRRFSLGDVTIGELIDEGRRG
jgi:antitoxin MazE